MCRHSHLSELMLPQRNRNRALSDDEGSLLPSNKTTNNCKRGIQNKGRQISDEKVSCEEPSSAEWENDMAQLPASSKTKKKKRAVSFDVERNDSKENRPRRDQYEKLWSDSDVRGRWSDADSRQRQAKCLPTTRRYVHSNQLLPSSHDEKFTRNSSVKRKRTGERYHQADRPHDAHHEGEASYVTGYMSHQDLYTPHGISYTDRMPGYSSRHYERMRLQASPSERRRRYVTAPRQSSDTFRYYHSLDQPDFLASVEVGDRYERSHCDTSFTARLPHGAPARSTFLLRSSAERGLEDSSSPVSDILARKRYRVSACRSIELSSPTYGTLLPDTDISLRNESECAQLKEAPNHVPDVRSVANGSLYGADANMGCSDTSQNCPQSCSSVATPTSQCASLIASNNKNNTEFSTTFNSCSDILPTRHQKTAQVLQHSDAFQNTHENARSTPVNQTSSVAVEAVMLGECRNEKSKLNRPFHSISSAFTQYTKYNDTNDVTQADVIKDMGDDVEVSNEDRGHVEGSSICTSLALPKATELLAIPSPSASFVDGFSDVSPSDKTTSVDVRTSSEPHCCPKSYLIVSASIHRSCDQYSDGETEGKHYPETSFPQPSIKTDDQADLLSTKETPPCVSNNQHQQFVLSAMEQTQAALAAGEQKQVDITAVEHKQAGIMAMDDEHKQTFLTDKQKPVDAVTDEQDKSAVTDKEKQDDDIMDKIKQAEGGVAKEEDADISSIHVNTGFAMFDTVAKESTESQEKKPTLQADSVEAGETAAEPSSPIYSCDKNHNKLKHCTSFKISTATQTPPQGRCKLARQVSDASKSSTNSSRRSQVTVLKHKVVFYQNRFIPIQAVVPTQHLVLPASTDKVKRAVKLKAVNKRPLQQGDGTDSKPVEMPDAGKVSVNRNGGQTQADAMQEKQTCSAKTNCSDCQDTAVEMRNCSAQTDETMYETAHALITDATDEQATDTGKEQKSDDVKRTASVRAHAVLNKVTDILQDNRSASLKPKPQTRTAANCRQDESTKKMKRIVNMVLVAVGIMLFSAVLLAIISSSLW